MIVDVVIPVFGGAHRVGRAIESALTQQLDADLVVHAIDDGSADASAAVLAELAAADARVRVSRNPRNLGVAATRNRAVRAGMGEYIAFLDQDDAWTPGSLARRIAALASEPALGYVVGMQAMTLEPGEQRPAWCRPEWLEAPIAGYLPSTLVVRRKIFEQVGPLDESMRAGGDDTDWFARARLAGVAHRLLDDTIVIRYVHADNKSSDYRTSEDLLRVVRQHVRRGEVGG